MWRACTLRTASVRVHRHAAVRHGGVACIARASGLAHAAAMHSDAAAAAGASASASGASQSAHLAAVLDHTRDAGVAYAASKAMAAAAGASAPAAAGGSASRAEAARVAVRQSPVLEMSYRAGRGDSAVTWVAVLLREDWTAAAAAQPIGVVRSASQLRLLSVARAARGVDAQQRAWGQALRTLRPQTSTDSADGGVNLEELLQAGLDAVSSQSQEPSIPQGVQLNALRRAWSEHSQAALRLFLRSFVEYAQATGTTHPLREGADEALPPLRLQSDEAEKEAPPVASTSATASAAVPAAVAGAVAATANATATFNFRPLLQPASTATSPASAVSIAALDRRLRSMNNQSADERYEQLRRDALMHMLDDLYPDPAAAADETDAAARLQRRQEYAASVGWPASAATDASEFRRRFLRPRRIELTLTVSDCVDACEQQLLAESIRLPGDDMHVLRPRIGAANARRIVLAVQALGGQDLHTWREKMRRSDVQTSPAPFSSWEAVLAAISRDKPLPTRIEQVRSLFLMMGRDQAVLHAAPFFAPRTEVRARRELHRLFHTRMRARLLAERHAHAQSAHLDVEMQLAAFKHRQSNQVFLNRFGSAAGVLPDAAGRAADATPPLPDLVAELDQEDVVSLHDSLLSSLSRELDVPLSLLRVVLDREDQFVRRHFAALVREEAARRGLAAEVDELSDAELLPPLPHEAAEQQQRDSEQLEMQDEEADWERERSQMEGEEEEMDDDEDDVSDDHPAPSSSSSASLESLRSIVHRRMLAENDSYAVSEGSMSSAYPLSRGEWNKLRAQLAELRADWDNADRICPKEALATTVPLVAPAETESVRVVPAASTSHAAASASPLPHAAASSVAASASHSYSSVPAPALRSSGPTTAAQSSSSPDSQSAAAASERDGSDSSPRSSGVVSEDALDHSDSSSVFSVRSRFNSRRRSASAQYFSERMMHSLQGCVPGGVRLATEAWMKSPLAASRATPDALLLDDVRVRVLYPALPNQPHTLRATELVPMRWLEVKAAYGASLHYTPVPFPAAAGDASSASAASASGAVVPSPSVAMVLEQSMRYQRLFGPGCVVFEKGFCDSWLREVFAPDGSHTLAMPLDVNFLDVPSMLHITEANVVDEDEA